MKAELLHRYQTLLHQVQEQAHTLEDLIEGRTTVDVEGNGGRDVFRAKQLGLFTANVKGVDIIATCEAEAAPLIHYLEQGGVYGSLEFSRLLGYSEEQLAQYQELLLLQDKLGIPPWGYRKASENEPTNEELWGKAIAEAKKRFDKYPSAYANGWAAKWYKERGGGWRKKEARGKAKKDVGHGGLDEWFSGHSGGKGDATWGDWVAISPVTKELESGKKVKPGDIVGPCGISDDPDWKDVTKGGKDPLKCMPRQKAHDMPKAERADLAKDKMKAERQEGNTKKPVMTPTFKKDSAQRVASRYLTAGVLEAPPAMVKSIGKWIMAVAAATYIDQISNVVSVGANPYQFVLDNFAVLRQALASGKILAIIKAYKEAILNVDARFNRDQFKRLDPKVLQGLDKALVEQRLKGWMSAVEAEIASRTGGRSALDDERIEVLKRHLMSGVGPATNAEAVRVFPIDTTGWKYDGPALLKMIQDRFVSFTQKEIDFEQRRKTPDPESLSILQAELARTLMGDFPNSKITVKVSLRGEGAKVRGKWSSASQMLIVTVPPMQRLEVRGIKGVTDELYGTLRHELQHMAQWLIRLAVMDTMSHIDAKRQTIPSPGMPSKKIMTPQWRQQQGDDVDDESHAMDDLEFFTRLKDAIKAAQRGLAEQSKRIQSAQKRPASVAEQQQFLLAFLGEKRDPNVEPNTSFVTWKRMAKGKWKRAIKEFFAAFPILARAPSAPRVSSRYLMAAEGKYDHINFKPPESVANAAKKGLEYRQKASPSNKGGLTVSEAAKQGIGSGVQRAVNLKNRDEVSPETIGKMVAFFSRHEKNKGIAPEHKSEPWNDKGHVAWLLWGGDPGRTWAEKVKGQMEAADKKKSASRVAQRYLEAGVTDWLKWIVQPFAVLAKHHREFVYGPVDDAFDAVLKELAPKLVRELTEKEVESDVDDFLRGALAGRDGKPLSSSESADFRAGYVWGKVNKDDKDLQRGDLPAYMKRQVIQSSVAEFRKRITETVLKDALKKAWHAINPMTTFNAIKSAVKKHGWKLGVGFALFELFEHFVLPAVLSTLFDDPRLLSLATLPIGEVVYAVMFRILGRTPAEVNKADEAGHLDWYEQEFGPIRLAALPS